MNELALTVHIKEEWYDKLYAENAELWAAVRILLGICQKSGLPLSKERSTMLNLDDNETIAVYVLDCHQLGMDAEDLTRFGHEARRTFKYFPASPEFSGALKKVKNDKVGTTIEDTVYVLRLDEVDKVVAVMSKKQAIKEGRQYALTAKAAEALPHPFQPALPGVRQKPERRVIKGMNEIEG